MISIISAGLYCLTRLLRTSDSKPDMSFDIPASLELLSDPGLDVSVDMPASPKYLFGLAYASLAEDNLNELIINYKIPRDLHPQLPSKEFVMIELPADAVGVYHRIFDFSCVCIPFSSFLLAIIKYYMVYFTQLGPLGLNKRHSSSAIDDLWPPTSSFNMDDVHRLSAHVVKLRDINKGFWSYLVMGIHDFHFLPEWTGAEVQEEPHHDIRPTLQRLPFYYTPPGAIDAVVLDLTLKDLAAGTPSAKKFLWSPLSTLLLLSLPQGTRPRVLFPSLLKVLAPEPSSGPTPSLREVSGDAIHKDFFPFSAGPYYATYLKGGVTRNVSLVMRSGILHTNLLLCSSPNKCSRIQLQREGERKNIKSFTKSLDQLNAEPKKLTRPANVPTSWDTRISPPVVKESTLTLVSSSLELLSNIVPSSFAAPLEPNEEWVNAMVDGPDNEMIGSDGNGDGSMPSSVADAKVFVAPYKV
nr:hypothetical protein [Tanacetum cinerariifolium]